MLFLVVFDMLLDEACRLYLWIFDRQAYATLYVVPHAYRLSQDAEAAYHYPSPKDMGSDEWQKIGDRAQAQASALWEQAETCGWQPGCR